MQPIEHHSFEPGREVPLNVTSRLPSNLCPELSIVQYSNFKLVCWTNAAMVVLRYAFQKTGNFVPSYDPNSEQFPALEQDSFQDFFCQLASLQGSYVVKSSEPLIKSFLDQYFSDREEHEGETIKETLYKQQNEPEDFLGK